MSLNTLFAAILSNLLVQRLLLETNALSYVTNPLNRVAVFGNGKHLGHYGLELVWKPLDSCQFSEKE